MEDMDLVHGQVPDGRTTLAIHEPAQAGLVLPNNFMDEARELRRRAQLAAVVSNYERMGLLRVAGRRPKRSPLGRGGYFVASRAPGHASNSQRRAFPARRV